MQVQILTKKNFLFFANTDDDDDGRVNLMAEAF